MLGNEKSRSANFQTDYAQRADFCEVFENNMDCLYLLAFLLTANHKDAEQCFASTVDGSFKQTRVFKSWARSWVKRCLVQTAIQISSPTTTRKSEKRDRWIAARPTAPDRELDAVTRLAPLERFVFVMSVLERYSVLDCSLLLRVSMEEVRSAQMRALRQLPDPAMFLVGAEAMPSDRLQATA